MEKNVNNCITCPLAMHSDRYANRCGHPEIRSEGYQVFFDKNEVLPNCPLKKSPLIIKTSIMENTEKEELYLRYLNAYEQVASVQDYGESDRGWNTPYACDYLQHWDCMSDQPCLSMDYFQEFLLFAPEKQEHNIGWWAIWDFDARLNALAFCMAMLETE